MKWQEVVSGGMAWGIIGGLAYGVGYSHGRRKAMAMWRAVFQNYCDHTLRVLHTYHNAWVEAYRKRNKGGGG